MLFSLAPRSHRQVDASMRALRDEVAHDLLVARAHPDVSLQVLLNMRDSGDVHAERLAVAGLRRVFRRARDRAVPLVRTLAVTALTEAP